MRLLSVITVLSSWIMSVHTNDQCRLTKFSDQVKNQSLKGHVIRVAIATDDLHCQLLCSIEGACSSFNLGPLKGGQHLCELSDSDHTQHPEEYEYREGFVYRYATLNLCGGVKCLYNASCQVIQGKKSPQCVCTPGYTGDYCNTDINECASNPCQNGGRCTDAVNGYTCSCASGWDGEQCTTNIDECASNPCQNGGTCSDAVNGYSCSCASGWAGVHCTDFNECASNPCQNGGTCTDAVNGYTCSCASGWTGVRCTTNIDECASNPCQNGGACTDAVNGYSCSCASGWAGEQCTTAIGAQCSSYTQLSEADRHKSYGAGTTMCDSGLVTKWYRFIGSAGSKIATSCVAQYHCSTHAPGWLNGAHPTEAEGIVTRQVCYHWNSNCCNWSNNITVLNCGQYYIYELVQPPVCSLRYCGE